MATDNSTGSSRGGHTVSGFVSTAARLVIDALAITAWVVLLALLFLGNSWPRWAFYTLLVVGVGVYVTLTATWGRSGDST